VFYLKRRYNLFGNEKKNYCSWIPMILAFKTQGEGKQLLAASYAV
jgi:hypothetical protein